MITVDSKDLLKDLQEFYLDTVRRLEQMVRGFSYEIALTAIEKTPLGDSAAYQKLYLRREKAYGLAPVEGLAKGGWQTSLDGTLEFQQLYGTNSGQTAASAARIGMMNYQLGQTVLIGNEGPYIQQLEDNYSLQTNGEGIMQPTLDSIMAVHRADLMRYYKQG